MFEPPSILYHSSIKYNKIICEGFCEIKNQSYFRLKVYLKFELIRQWCPEDRSTTAFSL